jgi:hypothetical protein
MSVGRFYEADSAEKFSGFFKNYIHVESWTALKPKDAVNMYVSDRIETNFFALV